MLMRIPLLTALTVTMFCGASIFLAPSPAQAASAGCTAANGGSLNGNAGAGLSQNAIVNGAFAKGDKLTIVIAGGPTTVRFDLIPSNTRIVNTSGSQTLMVTISEDGVAAIAFTLISSGVSASSTTVTCTPAAAPTSSMSTSTTATPDETSDAIDASSTATSVVRQPTTPNSLPDVDTSQSNDNLYDQERQFEQAYRFANVEIKELTAKRDALFAEVDPNYEPPLNQYSEARRRGYKEDTREDFWHGYSDDGAGSGEGYRDGKEYRSQVNAIYAAATKAASDAGRLDELQQITGDLKDAELRKSEAFSKLNKVQGEIRRRPSQQKTPPYQWLNASGGNGFNFNIDLSTDMLRGWAQAHLDESEAPETVLPPLTIAGMPVNIWVRGRGTIFDAQNRFGNDGWAGHVLSGIALKTNEKITIGAFGSYLTSSTETKFNNSEIDSTSVGGGAYINMKLVDTISAGLSINREVGEQDIKIGTTTGTADTGLTAVGASLQGSWFVDPVFVSPSLSVSYSDYIREKYTDSTGTVIPSSRSRDTTIAAAATASRTYSFEEGGWFTSASPRVSATLNYFARENRSLRVSTAQIIDLTDWGGNVGTGVTLATEGNSTISIDLGVIGIGQDTLGYTGQLQVDFGF